MSSTLRAGTDLDFKVQNSNCAESVDSGPAHITYNPQTFQDTAFKAIDSGDCFWKFSEATWAVSVVYPGKHPVYEAAWLYFKINQLGPKLYGTSCTVHDAENQGQLQLVQPGLLPRQGRNAHSAQAQSVGPPPPRRVRRPLLQSREGATTSA